MQIMCHLPTILLQIPVEILIIVQVYLTLIIVIEVTTLDHGSNVGLTLSELAVLAKSWGIEIITSRVIHLLI
jgi:hypothetical protein